ncbi:MAG: CheR family methyltransferase, partial [Paludibacter sp.]
MESTSLTIKKQSLSEMETKTNSPAGVKEGMNEKTDDIRSQNESSKVNTKSKNPFTVVAIGASAGGLEAITQFLENLSPTTGMAFIYVQHLSPDHKSMLTPLLSKATKMPVQDIDNMEKMEPNNVYIIPYNKVIEVTDGHIKLIPRPKEKTYILSIDVLFSSLAETHKENVIGIILSGSNTDGTRGLKEIKLAGGLTFAQDNSAKFSTMPESAIAKGVIDFILSPKEIAGKLNWMSKHAFVRPGLVKIAPENEIENNNPNLNKILQILLKEKSVDFSHYKMNTIKRRMIRRMMINKVKTLKQYSELVEQKSSEVDLLYQDLLINVTDFFRDADAFLLLRNSLLPRLIKTKAPGETLRIWVAACATGEEVYSIAIMLLEMKEKKTYNIPFQIFGTDLSPKAIAEARIGEYTLHQLKNVSPKRLQRFFTKSKDKYRISKDVRDVCVFAKHNILNDPPFSHMDLISCRNFLIYLDALAQKKAISTFHYGLNESGCLMLGKSETVGASTQLFSSLDKKFKIYTRKKISGPSKIPDLTPRISQISNGEMNTKLSEMTINTSSNIKKTPSAINGNLSNAFDAILLSQYVPASVIINYDLEILQFRGSTSHYLQHAPGRASFNILKMVHVEISFELRNAIHHAIKTNQTVRKMDIEMNRDQDRNTVQNVNIEVTPLKVEGEEPLLVVVFSGHEIELGEHTVHDKKYNNIAKDKRIRKLEEELAAARADMGTITQDQEAANEELQSANEEIISSNEELQSLNEELETSKEEIESTNEELSSSNQELNARILQIEEL